MPRNPRKTASLKHERQYQAFGCRHIMGIDEAGRGPWAGPVVAGVVCLPLERKDLSTVLEGVRDSKQMTALQRAKTRDLIQEIALTWGVGSASGIEISAKGINPATKLAVQRAYEQAMAGVDFEPDCLFLDYMILPEMRHIPQLSIIGGDQHSLSIAAASVLAKVWRDEYMLKMNAEYPEYGFADHKGYGTERHRAAIEKYGACPLHRMNYKPLLAYAPPGNE